MRTVSEGLTSIVMAAAAAQPNDIENAFLLEKKKIDDFVKYITTQKPKYVRGCDLNPEEDSYIYILKLKAYIQLLQSLNFDLLDFFLPTAAPPAVVIPVPPANTLPIGNNNGVVDYTLPSNHFLENYPNLPSYFKIFKKFRSFINPNDPVGGDGKRFKALYDDNVNKLMIDHSNIGYNIRCSKNDLYTLGVILGMHGIKDLFNFKNNQNLLNEFIHTPFIIGLIRQWVFDLVDKENEMLQMMNSDPRKPIPCSLFNWTKILPDYWKNIFGTELPDPKKDAIDNFSTMLETDTSFPLAPEFLAQNGYDPNPKKMYANGEYYYEPAVLVGGAAAAPPSSSCHVRR